MKKILSLLTLALLGAATTASAAYYYDEVYGTTNPTKDFNVIHEEAAYWTPSWQVDTVAYKDFEISRMTQQGGVFSGTSDNFFMIHVTKDNVKLSLTDFVDNIQDGTNGIGYNSNALVNKGVTKYGYRVLDQNGNIVYDDEGKAKGETFDMPALKDMTEADVIDSGTVNDHSVNRYKYDLGTFDKDTYIEIYLKSGTTEAYSYNALTDIPYNGEKYDDQGGFADGYTVSGAVTDKLLNLYYGVSEERTRQLMPLAGLDIGVNESRVYFGIYSQAVGSPLPGGLPIVLVAGLFGLGFWYIRRRKAVAA